MAELNINTYVEARHVAVYQPIDGCIGGRLHRRHHGAGRISAPTIIRPDYEHRLNEKTKQKGSRQT
jgi:hypothetical protein